MVSYIIKATNLSNETGTVIADVGFHYSDNLNDINDAEIKISGSGSVKRSLLEIGSEIEISKNGTLEFLGIIDNIDFFEAGTVVFHVSGYEWWLAKENGSYANSPWKATDSATVFGDILAESNYLTAGTIEAGFATDYRLALSQSLWNGISNLAKKTQQDIQVDYTNKEIDVLDHRGSSTSVATYNEGTNIKNVRVNLAYPLGNHILVFGKGDGVNQITGSAEDATSISTYGRIKKTIIDRSIISTAEANKLAIAELALVKDTPKIIDFDFNNPNENISTGDIITINAADLSDEEVRIVGIDKGIRAGDEFLTAQVTNPAFKQLIRRRNKILAKLTKDQIDQGSYMEGSGNTLTFGGIRNANNSTALTVNFNIPTGFITDEAGNIRVTSFTMDYDVDKYNSQYGTVSFDGTDPPVNDKSADNDELSTITGGDNSVAAITLEDAWETVDTFVIGANDHGQQIVFHLSAWITERSSNQNEDFSVNGRITDGFDEWPIEDGIRLCRGRIRHSGTTDAESDHTHGTGASPEDLFCFSTFCSSIDACSSSTSSGSSHTHTFSLDIPLNGEGTIIVPIDPAGRTFYVQLQITHATGYALTGCKTTYSVHSRHKHDPGDYKILATDIDDISIGDGVGEAGSTNASEVNIYLDFWNGSAWINKHSILTTGETLDLDVDLSDGGTYPDAAGYWRARILTDHASADLVQAIIKLKHNLDN